MNTLRGKFPTSLHCIYYNYKLRDQYVHFFKDGTIGIQIDISRAMKNE